MARTSRTSRRTEREIAEDLTAILGLQRLHEDTLRGIVWKLIWDFTELDGKWDNPRFVWSVRAAQRRRKNRGGTKGLRREHCYPMSTCIADLLALPSPTVDEVLNGLRRASTVYVLTVEEDAAVNREHKSSWPADFPSDDPLARYKATKGLDIEFAPVVLAGSPSEPDRA